MLANISRKIVLTHSTLAALLITNGIVSTLAIYHVRSFFASGSTAALCLIWGTICVGLGIALFGGIHLHAVVCGGLARQQRKFSEVADTLDLSRRASSPRNDEFGRCAIAFDRFMTKIDDAIRDVRIFTDTVAVATGQIAAGNIDLSVRTDQQAASLQETAATLRELTTTVSDNAINARQAFELANSVSQIASFGNGIVQELVERIDAVKEGSSKISAITTLIEGIAFQTNILALNAAVESARAGEQGRGFAVVASEVRSLAQRTSVAAKEIATLISSSSTLVKDAAMQATAAGNTMIEVQSNVTKVCEVVGDIANACESQQTAIRQVDAAVSDIEAVTQQNAALVEQAVASTHSLSEQTSNLSATVGAFTLSRKPR